VTERLIGEYETRLQTEPNNLKLMRRSRNFTRRKNSSTARWNLRPHQKFRDGRRRVARQAIANTIVRRFDFQIAELLNPFGAEHAAQVAKIQAEKLDFQVAECQKRVEKFPTDLAIRFEMGALYFQAGKSARPFRNCRRRRATRTSASPR
jgi:hypothetical protein